MTAISPKVEVSEDAIASFCDRWKITEFALFGSILRDDFRPDSDVDVLVSFAPDAKWSLWGIIAIKRRTRNPVWAGGRSGTKGLFTQSLSPL